MARTERVGASMATPSSKRTRRGEATASMEEGFRSFVQKELLSEYEDMDEEDALTLFDLLVETKFLDYSNVASTEPRWEKARRFFKFNENVYVECKGPPRTNGSSRKRITCLHIGKLAWHWPSWEFHTDKVFSLLSKLECLETLCLYRCNSFRFTETISNFPNLKHLDVGCKTKDGTTIGSLDFLLGMRPSNLETIYLGSYTIASEDDLATLLFKIFPALPNLDKFHVDRNNVKSLKNIAERICGNKSNESRLASNIRLRCLDLGDFSGNTTTDILEKNDREEAEALKTILRSFRELNEIVGLFGWPSSRRELEDLPADVSHLMELNFTGRILVESMAEEGSTMVPSIHSPIPLSLWPSVLTRIWKQKGSAPIYHTRQFKNPDGIYYLLRNLRLLQEGAKRNYSRGRK